MYTIILAGMYPLGGGLKRGNKTTGKNIVPFVYRVSPIVAVNFSFSCPVDNRIILLSPIKLSAYFHGISSHARILSMFPISQSL